MKKSFFYAKNFLFLISSDELYDVDYQDDGNEVGEDSPHEGAYHADNHYHCHEDKDGYEPAGHAYLMDGAGASPGKGFFIEGILGACA